MANALENILGGFANEIGKAGRSLAGLFGTPIANLRDQFEGTGVKTVSVDSLKKAQDSTTNEKLKANLQKAIDRGVDRPFQNGKQVTYTGEFGFNPVTGELSDTFEFTDKGKQTDALNKSLYSLDSKGNINYKKGLSDFVGTAMNLLDLTPIGNNPFVNALQGAVSSGTEAYADSEGDTSSALKAAAAGGLGSLAAGGANVGLNKLTENLTKQGAGKISKLAGSKLFNNSLTRGATAGAVGGGVGAGTSEALSGGNLEDILKSALEGAGAGAIRGGITAPALSATRSLISKIPVVGKNGIQGAIDEMQSDFANRNKQPQEVIEPEEQTLGDTDAMEQLKKATGWNGEEIDLSKRNALQKAGKAFKQTAENIQNSDVYNKLYSKTAEKVQRNDSVNRLKKLGFSPEDYDRAANYSETTNKFIKETIPDNPVKNTNIVADLTNIDDMTTGVINSDKLNTKVKNEVLRSIDNARTKNPNTIDEYSIKKLWDESERIGKLENEYRTKSMNVNGGDISSDYATAAEYLGNVRKQLRGIVDNEVNWGDTFDKDLLADRLKGAGADKANIDNITNAKNLAELKRNTALYEDARQMNKEMQTSRTRRNAVSGTGSMNPINVAAQESGVNEVLKTAARPIRSITSGVTNLAGNVLNSIGSVPSTPGDTSAFQNRLYDAIGRAEAVKDTTDTFDTQTPALEAQLAQMDTAEATEATRQGMNGDYYRGTSGTGTGTGTGSSKNGTSGGTFGNGTTGNNMLDVLQSAMGLALQAGDLDALSEIAGIYGQMSEIFKSTIPQQTTVQDLNTTQQDNIVKLNTAEKALDKLGNLYEQAGGGQGLGGNISNFLAGLGLNPDVKTYNDLSQGLINQIAAAVGKTDALNNEGEVQRALDLIPKITDDAQTAKNKLAELRSMLSETKQNYYDVYGLTQ